MRRERRLFLLGAISASMVIALIVAGAFPSLLRDQSPPEDFDALLRWVTRHPADWRAVSMASDAALDSDLPRRRELWHSTFALARRLAPQRINPPSGFVRAGLFHWYELSPAERQDVLRVVAPLMRDPEFFRRMAQPVWSLTRDLAWLRRVAPDTLEARLSLRDVAIRYGEFDDYRALRESIRNKRFELAQKVTLDAPIEDLLALVPDRLDTGDEPLVRFVLKELDRRPFNPERIGGGIAPLVEYAVEHDVQPMAGLRPIIESPGRLSDVTRARAALALGDHSLATRIEISSAVVGDARWIPYYVERAREEAEDGDGAAAEGYLARAAAAAMDVRVLAASEEVARITRQNALAAESHRQLLAARKGPGEVEWSGTCGSRELCSSAAAAVYLGAGEAFPLTLETVQSDEQAPYVEVYLDDQLVSEGEVGDSRTFPLRAAEAGVHRLQVRLVNGLAKNGVQRRARLS